MMSVGVEWPFRYTPDVGLGKGHDGLAGDLPGMVLRDVGLREV